MTTFLLIATILVGGASHDYILDHNLTYEDCQRALHGEHFSGPVNRNLKDMELRCEPEAEAHQ